MKKLVSTFFAGKTLFYGLIFLTPFIFCTTTTEAFEFPKMYFVYFVGSLFILVALLGRLWEAGEPHGRQDINKRLKSNDALDSAQRRFGNKEVIRISWLVGLIVISFGISTAFSTHLYTSLWGYFSRFNGGFVSVLIFFGIYLSTLHLKPKTHAVLKTVALTLIPVSLYSILQHFGLGGSWATDTTVRAFSTFGQPNWYGAYCAMVLPIVLYLGLNGGRENQQPSAYAQDFKKRSYNGNQIKNLLGWSTLFVLGFAGFWFSYSVSGIIGLITSSVLVLILNIKATRKNWCLLIVLAGLCLSVAFLNQGIFNQKFSDALTDIFAKPSATTQSMDGLTPQNPEEFVNTRESESPPEITTEQDQQNVSPQKIPQTESTGYQLTDSGLIRKGIWEGTIRLWLASSKNFLIGAGPETFPYEFQKFRPLSLNYSSEWNYILNKPHNYYLELLAQNGLVGILIYLVIIIKNLLTKHPALTPALVGLFVTNFFGWPTVSTTLLFWIFLALLVIEKPPTLEPNLTDKKPSALKLKSSEIKLLASIKNPFPLVKTVLFPALLVVLYLYINIQFGRHVFADMFGKASDKYFEAGQSKKALNFSNRAVSLNPNEPFYYRQRAKTYTLTTVGQSNDQAAKIKSQTYKDLVTARNLNPQNLATLRGEIPLYYFLALKDLSDMANNQSQEIKTDLNFTDLHYLQLAKAYYIRLSQTYPNDVGVQAQIAKYQKMLGLLDDLEVTVSTIRKLRPDLLDWYTNL